jgi:hypothetical protein
MFHRTYSEKKSDCEVGLFTNLILCSVDQTIYSIRFLYKIWVLYDVKLFIFAVFYGLVKLHKIIECCIFE